MCTNTARDSPRESERARERERERAREREKRERREREEKEKREREREVKGPHWHVRTRHDVDLLKETYYASKRDLLCK